MTQILPQSAPSKRLAAGAMAKESAKDPVIAIVMCFTREGWLPRDKGEASNDGLEDFCKVAVSLSTAHGCLR